MTADSAREAGFHITSMGVAPDLLEKCKAALPTLRGKNTGEKYGHGPEHVCAELSIEDYKESPGCVQELFDEVMRQLGVAPAEDGQNHFLRPHTDTKLGSGHKDITLGSHVLHHDGFRNRVNGGNRELTLERQLEVVRTC